MNNSFRFTTATTQNRRYVRGAMQTFFFVTRSMLNLGRCWEALKTDDFAALRSLGVSACQAKAAARDPVEHDYIPPVRPLILDGIHSLPVHFCMLRNRQFRIQVAWFKSTVS